MRKALFKHLTARGIQVNGFGPCITNCISVINFVLMHLDKVFNEHFFLFKTHWLTMLHYRGLDVDVNAIRATRDKQKQNQCQD